MVCSSVMADRVLGERETNRKMLRKVRRIMKTAAVKGLCRVASMYDVRQYTSNR